MTRMVGRPVVSSWIQGRAYLTVELRVFGARQTVGRGRDRGSKLLHRFDLSTWKGGVTIT